MPDVEKSKYFYRGHSQNWKTWKFAILTPCARMQAYRHHTYILYYQKRFQRFRQTPQKCPPPDTKPLAPTVYPLQGGKVGQNFEIKKQKFCGKKLFSLHYDQKNTLNPLVKSVLKSVHNYGRYLQFCDRLVCSFHHLATWRLQLRVWPILRTGLRPVQLFLVMK